MPKKTFLICLRNSIIMCYNGELNMIKPGKYSLFKCSDYDKRMVSAIRNSLNIPQDVHDDMINRQLKYCKDMKMSIEEAKAHVLKTYIDDINGTVSQETK